MSKGKEDLDVIMSAQKGNEEAWSDLVTRYSKRVWYATYGYGFSDADREDIVQEVFVKLIKSIKGYDPSRASFSTFVTAITKHTCIDKIRKPPVPEVIFEPEKLAKIPSSEKEGGDDENIQNKVKILRQVMDKELTSEAIEQYKNAYSLEPLSGIAYRIAYCYDKLELEELRDDWNGKIEGEDRN